MSVQSVTFPKSMSSARCRAWLKLNKYKPIKRQHIVGNRRRYRIKEPVKNGNYTTKPLPGDIQLVIESGQKGGMRVFGPPPYIDELDNVDYDPNLRFDGLKTGEQEYVDIPKEPRLDEFKDVKAVKSGLDEKEKIDKIITDIKESKLSGEGIVDLAKRAYRAGKNAIGLIPPPREGPSPLLLRMWDVYGDRLVKRISVVRTPIQGAIQKVANFIKNGLKWIGIKPRTDYDILFHLYMVVEIEGGLLFRAERNETVQIYRIANFPKLEGEHDKFMIANLERKEIPFQNLVMKAADKQGASFWRYHPTKNNCQWFVLSVLRAWGIGNAALYDFIKQDTDELLPEFITNAGQKVTDIAAGLRVLRGQGSDARICSCREENKRPIFL